MPFVLGDRQYQACALLNGPQRNTLLVGGARSSKTTLIVRNTIMRAVKAPASRHVILRFRQNAVKRSINLDTFPKTMEMCFPGISYVPHRQDSYFTLPNKSEIWTSGLDEKERVEQILGLEFCVDPEALLLTADLRWVTASKVREFDELIGFPEELEGHTRLKRSIVKSASIIEAEKYKIVTTRGETIVSANHAFVGYFDDRRHRNFRSVSWIKARDLKEGDKIRYASQPWKVGKSYDDGWLAGIFDGEGWCSSGQVGVGQNPGPTLERIERLLTERGIRIWRSHQYAKNVQLVARGMWDAMRVMGITRPQRLMRKSHSLWENRRGFVAWGNDLGKNGKKVREDSRHVAAVLKVEPLGRGPVVALSTSTETFIADGFLGHNSTIFLNECSQIPYSSVLMVKTRLAQQVKIKYQGRGSKQWNGKMLSQRMYFDLNPTGTGHYTYKMFIEKKDPETLRPLIDGDQYGHMFLSPFDNIHNLGPEYIADLETLPERQRKRFLEGVYVPEVEGALWTVETLERCRLEPTDAVPHMARIVVAVDPSGTTGDEDDRSDEVGIIVAGLGSDGIAYVLKDATCKLSPAGWGQEALKAYIAHHADLIVAEVNFGGEMVRFVIQAAAKRLGITVRVKRITASRGKVVRAEPISAHYEAGRVRHVGTFMRLEDQMLNMSTSGFQGHRSPDRIDALVWALSELLVKKPPAWAQPIKTVSSSGGGAIPIYAR